MPLPQYPARVKVTTKDGAVLWLGDPPEAPWGTEHRWRLVEDPAAAGVWPWPRAVELERAVRQPWRQQYATAERVEEEATASVRSETGDRARARAEACGVPDWQHREVGRLRAERGDVRLRRRSCAGGAAADQRRGMNSDRGPSITGGLQLHHGGPVGGQRT